MRGNSSHSLIFCQECGSLLDMPGIEDYISCNICGHSVDCREFENIGVVTASRAGTFEKRVKLDDSAKEKIKEGATIKEKCPKCDATEMTFHTMQLRSADEGQTVFYNCSKCGYKYKVNN